MKSIAAPVWFVCSLLFRARSAPLAAALFLLATASPLQANDSRELLWGDTHLHTSYSFDAFLNGNLSVDPDTAYRWAKGEPVVHPYHRARVRIETPLDFLLVADHAEYLGVIRKLYYEVEEGESAKFAEHVRRAIDAGKGAQLFGSVLPAAVIEPGETRDPITKEGQTNQLPIPDAGEPLRRTAWAETTSAADRHNDPGQFTAMIGWEWSSLPNGANLHRVVMTSANGETARRFMPFGSNDSSYPDDLWNWLEKTEAEFGSPFLAIPHNSNISKGYMWGATRLDETPYTAKSAAMRARWEPVSEVTQYKGDSETHPSLSPEDPFADFETYPGYIQTNLQTYKASVGDYARSGLRRGLEIGNEVGANPYKFGMIGATDSHTGLAAAEEDNFWGKMALDSTPETKLKFGAGRNVTGWNMQAGGLAAVWADENTRESIFDAFQRREVYATTGPRIQLRFFGGWQFREQDAQAVDLARRGYAKGVSMGSDLAGRPDTAGGFVGLFGGRRATAPSFLVQAAKDPVGANLDRVQIVKGWVDSGGTSHERVYNVAWAGERTLDANGALPAIGNEVDLETGATRRSSEGDALGSAELATVWTDPDFDPEADAFYYVRVLQVPTPRHSLLDAIALQAPPSDAQPPTLQERAYSSPIWYTP